MTRSLIIGVCGLVLTLSVATGCGRQEPAAPDRAGGAAPGADYEAEARQAITEENLEQELDALERQLETEEQELTETP